MVYCSECIYLQRIYGVETCTHPNNRKKYKTRGNYEYRPEMYYKNMLFRPKKKNKHNRCVDYEKGKPRPEILGEREFDYEAGII